MTTETIIKTDLGHHVHISSYNGGDCWLVISTDQARINVSVQRRELAQLIKGLQAIQEDKLQDDYREEKRAEGDDEVRESRRHADEVLGYEHG